MTYLFPKPPKRMRQPSKPKLREELARSAATIEQQRVTIEYLERALETTRSITAWNRPARPWWRRLLRKSA